MAYNSNIQPGNPPLLWDKFKSALDDINANFVTIGATLAGGEQKTITNATQASPVVVTTSTAHGLTDGQRVTITDVVGMTQLNGNTYYADVLTSNTFALYTDAGISSAVNGTGFTAYASGGKTQGLNEFSTLNLEALTTSVKPADDGQKVLGDATHKWKELHIAETLASAGNEDNGLYLGTAHVKGESGKVDLPFGSTIGGDLIIDPEKRYFRYINLDDGDIVEADHTNDTLSFYGGTGVQLVAGSDADSITFINDGVTQAIASTGITVSSATGNVTITNTGVTSAQNTTNIPSRATGRTAGEGITVSSTTGAVQFTNTGVLEVQQGFGITVSTDPATGIATVTNSAPAVPTFQQIAVDGQTSIAADSTADILRFENGYGINITLDSPNDKITVALDQKIDITGSVFADDSTILVDGVLGRIVAPVFADTNGTHYGPVQGTVTGNLVGPSAGVHTGEVKGSVVADDSTLLVDGVDGKIVGNVDSGSVLVGALAPNTISVDVGADSNRFENAWFTGNIATDSLTANLITGNLKGTVVGDDSTILVDGVSSTIPAAVLQGTATIDIRGSVFGDDSSVVIDGATGTVTGKIAPGSAAPSSETEAAEVGEIRVDDNYVYVRKSTGWGRIAIGGWV
jgi:hypothetical protein